MNNGWIKTHRKFKEWEWYQDANTFRVFFNLLISANHEPKKWRGFDIGIGEVPTGRKKLSEELNLSEQNIRTALKHLELTNEITIKSHREFSIIKLNNWNQYQLTNQQTNQLTNQQPTNNQPTPNHTIRTKRIKELKNKEEEGKSKRFIPPSTEEVILLFLEKGSTSQEADNFWNFYESKGWMVGKNKMKSWKASVSVWIARNKDNLTTPNHDY